ncbi:long-chain fatty acid--CoA ligase [Bacillus carboniphilus]
MSDQDKIMDLLITFMRNDIQTDDEFNRIAMHLFRYQFTNNLVYQRFCLQKGKTPRTVKMWRDIPAVPINAFKELTLSCIDPLHAERIFMTSGTTKGIRGKHFHPKMDVWDYSMILNFKSRFMKGIEKVKMGVLFPTEEEMPNSSLARYLSLAKQEFGTSDSQYILKNNRIDMNLLIHELEKAERTEKPYALMGASYSLVHMLEQLEKEGKTFTLPLGSRVLDTGGFKNQAKEMDLDDFYDQITRSLGVPRENCINMYGMTELSTQFYDDGNGQVPSVKTGPPWIRTRVIHPLTGEDGPPGERGVLVHCDLANFNSVTTILTEDLGIEKENGFQLLGRVQGTEAKGCSLAVEEFLRTAQGTTQ